MEPIKKFKQINLTYKQLEAEYNELISQLSNDELDRFNAYKLYSRRKKKIYMGEKAYTPLAFAFMSDQEKEDLDNPPEKFLICLNKEKDVNVVRDYLKQHFVSVVVPYLIDAVESGKLKTFPFDITTYWSMDYEDYGALESAKLNFSSDELGDINFSFHVEKNDSSSELEYIIDLANSLQRILPKIKEFVHTVYFYEPRFQPL